MTTLTALPTLKLCKTCQCNVATSWDGFCAEHSGMRPLRDYQSRPVPRTTMVDPIGVELELVHPDGVRRVTPLERYVCYDGSLPPNGGEAKILTPAKKASMRVADTIQRARIAGCETSPKAGFHVHLSLRKGWKRSPWSSAEVLSDSDRTHTGALSAVEQWGTIVEDYLFSLMPQSRRNNRYCAALKANGITSHYSWLSWSQRIPTVEVRIHGCTLNAMKAKAWIDCCLNIRRRINNVIDERTRNEELGLARLAMAGSSISRPAIYLGGTSLGESYLLAREKSPSLTRFGF